MIESRAIPQIDYMLLYFLDYYGPKYVKIDRKIALNQNVMQTMGQIILSCINNERNFFESELMHQSYVSNQLRDCIEF